VIVLGVIALVLLSVTGVSLARLEYVRLRYESRFNEAQLNALLNWEEIASLFGLGTGAIVLFTLSRHLRSPGELRGS
jgi:hypothetical protein